MGCSPQIQALYRTRLGWQPAEEYQAYLDEQWAKHQSGRRGPAGVVACTNCRYRKLHWCRGYPRYYFAYCGRSGPVATGSRAGEGPSAARAGLEDHIEGPAYVAQALGLQGRYDLEVERDRLGPVLDEIRPLKTA